MCVCVCVCVCVCLCDWIYVHTIISNVLFCKYKYWDGSVVGLINIILTILIILYSLRSCGFYNKDTNYYVYIYFLRNL